MPTPADTLTSRQQRLRCATPMRHPPLTAGIHPDRPVRVFPSEPRGHRCALLSTLQVDLEAAGATTLIVVELADGTTAEITLDDAARDDAADSANSSPKPLPAPSEGFRNLKALGFARTPAGPGPVHSPRR
jgi:hypothetical protein